MKNLFIQSFMNENARTFLEVGQDEHFTSVPSEFNVSINGTCWITISKDNFFELSTTWGITESDIQKALDEQFNGTTLIFNIN